jgi:hypothetical protein
VAANLFAGGILTPGTLLAVFLATSDEAVLILLGNPGYAKNILSLLAVKVLIGTVAGYLIDFLVHTRHNHEEDMERICSDCGCHQHDHSHEHGAGFDSGQRWYVSMQCVGCWHYNLSVQKFIWQRKLRSRCLIEV